MFVYVFVGTISYHALKAFSQPHTYTNTHYGFQFIFSDHDVWACYQPLLYDKSYSHNNYAIMHLSSC